MMSLQMVLLLVVPLSLLVSTATATAAPPPPPVPWPTPDPRLRPIFHSPSDPATTGYAGDPNGMMFRRVPFSSPTTEGGIFHLFWQCFPRNGDQLHWCHAASPDYVRWIALPPVFGAGAESGGAAQLANGDIVAIFNLISKGGHYSARPDNVSDPLLTNWSISAPVPNLAGTDLAGGFKDGSGDGLWRIVTDRHEMSGAVAGANICKRSRS